MCVCFCFVPLLFMQSSCNYYNLMQITQSVFICRRERFALIRAHSGKWEMEKPHTRFGSFCTSVVRPFPVWHVGLCRVHCDSNQYLDIFVSFPFQTTAYMNIFSYVWNVESKRDERQSDA